MTTQKYLQKARRTQKTAHYLAGTLSSTMTERPLFVAPFNCEIVGAYVNDTTGFTADATDNWTITIKSKGALGTGTSQVAALTTTAGTTAFLPASLGTITNAVMTKGTALSLTMTKNSSGANTDNTVVSVVYREI
jgi:hypothetical protein